MNNYLERMSMEAAVTYLPAGVGKKGLKSPAKNQIYR
jgi:hypothetical protein